MLVKLFIDCETLLPNLKQIEKGWYLLVTTYRPSDRVELGPVDMGWYEVGMGRYGWYLLVTPSKIE